MRSDGKGNSKCYCRSSASRWNLFPLLNNIMLHELDMELERRGIKFGRYADDCNVYVKSKKSAERVMKSITKFIEKDLKFKVNKEKSKTEAIIELKEKKKYEFALLSMNLRRLVFELKEGNCIEVCFFDIEQEENEWKETITFNEYKVKTLESAYKFLAFIKENNEELL